MMFIHVDLKIFLLLFTVFLFNTFTAKGVCGEGVKDTCAVSDSANKEFNSHVVIVYYDKNVGKRFLLKAAKKWGSEIVYNYMIIPAVALTVPANRNLETTIKYFRKVKGVLQVNRDRICHLD